MRLKEIIMRLYIIKSSKLLILAIVLIISIQLNAQNSTYLKLPKLFDNKYCSEELMTSFYNENNDNLHRYLESNNMTNWLVYSDRDNNAVYEESDDESEVLQRISFMEPLFVTEVAESVNWLKVVRAADGESLGWIPARYLVLSDLPAVISKQGLTKKGLVLLTAEGFTEKDIDRAKKQMNERRFYSYPKIAESYFTDKRALKFQIFYVLKEDKNNDMLLLAQTDKINREGDIKKQHGKAKEVVLGWMQKSYITNWNTRICLEPNYGKKVYNYYKEEVKDSNKILVFGNKCEPINKYLNDGRLPNDQHYIAKTDYIEIKRQDASLMRMPILDDKTACVQNKKIVRVASIANIMDISEVPKPPTDLLNLNYIFIVDATESMKNYLDPIKNSIKRISTRANSVNSNIQTKYAIIAYRDYADGAKSYEVRKLTSDVNSFIEYVRGIQCESKDMDLPEAQYQGVIEGMKEINPPKTESNIIILIGDAGNHRNDPKYSIEQVIETINRYNASFISFQTNYRSDIAYRSFQRDTRKILESSAKKYNYGGSSLLNDEGAYNTERIFYTSDKTKLGAFRMFGYYTYADDGHAMDTKILEDNIDNAVSNYIEKVKKEIEDIDRLNNVKGGEHTTFSPELEAYLRMYYTEKYKLEGLNKTEITYKVNRIINYFKNYDGDLSVKALTVESYYNNKYPNLKRVIFLSANEKVRLETILRDLMIYDSDINDFKDALVYQVHTITHDPESNIKLLTLDEVWQILFNIPFGDQTLSNTKLEDLNKPNKSNMNFYKKFVDSIYAFIHKHYDGDSKLELAGQTFYWIPIEDFPGNGK